MKSALETNPYKNDVINSGFSISDISTTTNLKDFLTGSYHVGTTNYTFTDTSRDETFTADPTDKRELNVQVWYPTYATTGTKAPYIDEGVANAIAYQLNLPTDNLKSLVDSISTTALTGAPIANDQTDFPVIIYSHGDGGIRTENTFLIEKLVSDGYVVVGIDHTYNALATTFPDGRVITTDPSLDISKLGIAEQEKLFTQEVNERAADASFVLDKLENLNNDPTSLFNHHLDLSRVGIFGHSLGGATAAATMLQDKRFDAGIDMDGTLFGDVVNKGLDNPFMVLRQNEQLPEDLKSFFENSRSDSFDVAIEGTKHGNFTDIPLLVDALSNTVPQLANFFKNSVGSIDSQRGADIMYDYDLAFFDRYLKGIYSPLLDGESKYPEVSFNSDAGNLPEPCFSRSIMQSSGHV